METWVIFVKNNEVYRTAEFEKAIELCKELCEIFGKENISMLKYLVDRSLI